MATDLAVESKETPISLGTLERVVVGGDLSKLSSDQRLEWYTARCRAAGLDPVTQPFQYLTLQGKVTLYATKTATDQLTSIHKLSVEITSRQLIESIGVYEVTCRVTFPDGHSVEDLGALPVAGLKGEQASNALMKCVTKAKRRTILSACGLGMLDEMEIESIPGAVQVPSDYVPRALSNDSGHGKGNYAPPAEVKSWEALLKILCERWNGRWHDHWFGEYHDWPAGVPQDLVTQYRLVGRVIKVAKANGQIAVDGDGKHTQTLGVSALVWMRDKAGVEAQLESYLQQFFDLEKSKAELKLNPPPAPEDDPDAEYAEDEAILASEGGRQG